MTGEQREQVIDAIKNPKHSITYFLLDETEEFKVIGVPMAGVYVIPKSEVVYEVNLDPDETCDPLLGMKITEKFRAELNEQCRQRAALKKEYGYGKDNKWTRTL